MKTLSRMIVVILLATNLAAAQSDEIAPGDNLVVEGVAKIPVTLAEGVSRYTEFRYAGLSSWHPTKREMLSFFLTGEGYSVITAEDGQQALGLIGLAPPDLIITDIQMPNLNGIELIKRLRGQSQSSTVPIVVMSALGSGVVSEAIKAGANQSTPKPMQLEALLGLIQQLLS